MPAFRYQMVFKDANFYQLKVEVLISYSNRANNEVLMVKSFLPSFVVENRETRK